MSVERRIKNYLDDNGIKCIFVCEKTGISQNIFSRVYTGERKLRADEFLKVCSALDLNPSDFISAAKEVRS